jgi:hypothetical protein
MSYTTITIGCSLVALYWHKTAAQYLAASENAPLANKRERGKLRRMSPTNFIQGLDPNPS